MWSPWPERAMARQGRMRGGGGNQDGHAVYAPPPPSHRLGQRAPGQAWMAYIPGTRRLTCADDVEGPRLVSRLVRRRDGLLFGFGQGRGGSGHGLGEPGANPHTNTRISWLALRLGAHATTLKDLFAGPWSGVCNVPVCTCTCRESEK